MKCFEVRINGEKMCTAGVGDDGVLTSILSLVVRAAAEGTESENSSHSEMLDLRVGGLANRGPGVTERVEWLNRDLNVGDEIVIRIVESSECDEPESKEVQYEGCSFCRKKQAQVKKLIAGPAVFICDGCVEDSGNALGLNEPSGNITIVVRKPADATCSFCGRKSVEVAGIVGVPAARICNECIKICAEILARDV